MPAFSEPPISLTAARAYGDTWTRIADAQRAEESAASSRDTSSQSALASAESHGSALSPS